MQDQGQAPSPQVIPPDGPEFEARIKAFWARKAQAKAHPGAGNADAATAQAGESGSAHSESGSCPVSEPVPDDNNGSG